MSAILQMTKRLAEVPRPPCVPGVRLRHYAGPNDIERWLELRRRAFARARLGVRDWSPEEFAGEFLARAWWRPEIMWFAECPDCPDPIGSVTLGLREGPESSKPVVHWLLVLAGYRRRGIGRLLLATLEAAAWDRGHRQIWLETHSRWTEAVRLYTDTGYAVAIRETG